MTLVSGMTPGGDCHDGILDRQHNQRDRLGSGLAGSVRPSCLQPGAGTGLAWTLIPEQAGKG